MSWPRNIQKYQSVPGKLLEKTGDCPVGVNKAQDMVNDTATRLAYSAMSSMCSTPTVVLETDMIKKKKMRLG